jgi:aminoglycoside phosphotransferase (APT) family kinase protein
MNLEKKRSGEMDRMIITMASRSIPDFMYRNGTTYLSHPDFNLQNILIDNDANVIGIIDWDCVSLRCRSMGYGGYPLWLMHD